MTPRQYEQRLLAEAEIDRLTFFAKEHPKGFSRSDAADLIRREPPTVSLRLNVMMARGIIARVRLGGFVRYCAVGHRGTTVDFLQAKALAGARVEQV